MFPLTVIHCAVLKEPRATARYVADLYHAGLCHQDALEDFGKIPEVEGVVRLGWRWEQLRGDGAVDMNGGVYQRFI